MINMDRCPYRLHTQLVGVAHDQYGSLPLQTTYTTSRCGTRSIWIAAPTDYIHTQLVGVAHDQYGSLSLQTTYTTSRIADNQTVAELEHVSDI